MALFLKPLLSADNVGLIHANLICGSWFLPRGGLIFLRGLPRAFTRLTILWWAMWKSSLFLIVMYHICPRRLNGENKTKFSAITSLWKPWVRSRVWVGAGLGRINPGFWGRVYPPLGLSQARDRSKGGVGGYVPGEWWEDMSPEAWIDPKIATHPRLNRQEKYPLIRKAKSKPNFRLGMLDTVCGRHMEVSPGDTRSWSCELCLTIAVRKQWGGGPQSAIRLSFFLMQQDKPVRCHCKRYPDTRLVH